MADIDRDLEEKAVSQERDHVEDARRAWVEPEFVAMDMISAELGGTL